MDFAFTEDQEALRGLARQIFAERVTPERLKEVEAGAERFDQALWVDLGRAHLLGIAVPELYGGSGLGVVEACLLLEEAAAAAAPVPLAPAVLAGLAVSAHGSDEQRARLLPSLAAGDSVLSIATEGGTTPVSARRDGDGWSLDGVLDLVPAADAAARIVVPAETGVFLLNPRTAGVALERQVITSGQPSSRVTLAGAAVAPEDVLAEDAAPVQWILDRALVALCATQVGLAERALRMTAEYTSSREQFRRPLATFQAVQQRIADAYIDVEAMRWTTWRAAWRLDEGLPAAEEIAVAKFWAAEGGSRVTASAQHLHGGVGVDVDYPLHRYTLRAKEVELSLGGASRQLARLGDLIAEGAP